MGDWERDCIRRRNRLTLENIQRRRAIREENRRTLESVRTTLLEWAAFRQGHAAGKGEPVGYDESDAIRSAWEIGQLVRCYLTMLKVDGCETMRERWEYSWRRFRWTFRPSCEWPEDYRELRVMFNLLCDSGDGWGSINR